MNKINNIFSKNEIDNKLKDFKEGQDYSVSPSDEPNLKTYNFHNDKLRSMFVGDKVPVRITRKAYDDKNYSYRGHFEEGKNYYYSQQTWEGKNVPADEDGWRPVSEEMWKSSNGDYSRLGINFRPLNGFEPKQIEPIGDLKWKYNQLTDKLNSLLSRPESDFGVNGKEKKEYEIVEVKKDIAAIEREIEKERVKIEREKDNSFGKPDYVSCYCGRTFAKNHEHWMVEPKEGGGRDHFCSSQCAIDKYPNDRVEYYTPTWQNDNNHSNLQKENQELRQQLTAVQKQLAEVLEELKKLKNNSVGKDNEKLEQQIVQNEKLMQDSKNVSVAEVRDQINKSEALMKEFNNVSTNKDDKGDSLPYVIGGLVILVSAGIIGYFLLKKNKRNK